MKTALDVTEEAAMRTAATAAKQATRAAPGRSRARKPVVLVIDDDEFAQVLIRQTIDRTRWRVVFAADGASTLAKLAHMTPDAILMDMQLPDTDGVALTRRLRSLPETAGTPILMLTGDDTDETLQSSRLAGASGVLIKPVSLAAMLDALYPRPDAHASI